ncbi:MAG: FIST C-terminal domain-containing protein [Myxococcales bacterium]|nr:FIST C-terminal domain-containing protein [Myxococcales bacterium]
MLKVAVGQSEDIDAPDAIEEALAQCRATLGDAAPKAALVFATAELEHPPILRAIRESFPGIPLIGCTTDGEMSSVGGFSEASLVVALIAGDAIEVIAEVGRGVAEDPRRRAAETAARARARATQPIRCCITTPESLTTSVDAILEGLKEGLGDAAPIVGGAAGDQVKFVGTLQFFGDEVLQDAVPVLLLGGSLLASHGVASGWQPVGKRAKVTDAAQNTVRRIGDQTALAYYQRYIGDDNLPSGEYALAVFEPGRDSYSYYLRAPVHSDPETGAVTFFGEVPVGATVQITQSHRDGIIDACASSIAQARSTYPGEAPAAALCFSCAGRRHILGTRAAEEIEQLRGALGPSVPIAGFYAYAEIGPTGPGRPAQLHNETFITLLLGER